MALCAIISRRTTSTSALTYPKIIPSAHSTFRTPRSQLGTFWDKPITEIVVLGDSYAAGNGAGWWYAKESLEWGKETISSDAPTAYQQQTKSDDLIAEQCRRVKNAWPEQFSKAIPGANFLNLACHAASTWYYTGTMTSMIDGKTEIPPQQTQLYKAISMDYAMGMPDLVLMSLGGNDAGYLFTGHAGPKTAFMDMVIECAMIQWKFGMRIPKHFFPVCTCLCMCLRVSMPTAILARSKRLMNLLARCESIVAKPSICVHACAGRPSPQHTYTTTPTHTHIHTRSTSLFSCPSSFLSRRNQREKKNACLRYVTSSSTLKLCSMAYLALCSGLEGIGYSQSEAVPCGHI